jgi:hypothetical protein
MPWLRWLVAGLSLWRPGFTPVSVHVELMVDKVAWDSFFSKFFGFPLVSIILVWPYMLIY